MRRIEYLFVYSEDVEDVILTLRMSFLAMVGFVVLAFALVRNVVDVLAVAIGMFFD